jgi:hypothetical protein
MKIGFSLVFKDGIKETTITGTQDMPGVRHAGDARDRAIKSTVAKHPELAGLPVVDSAVGKAR